MEVPWEDVHFWSGAQKNMALETHETLNLTEYGYDLLYKTWGPSMLRKLDVLLRGYEFSINSDNPIMQEHKSTQFKHQAALLWNLLYAMDRFAPNGVVRRRVRKIDEMYRKLIGEPTPMMEYLGNLVEKLAKKFYIKNVLDPFNRYPKEEPYKQYIYNKDGAPKEDAIPYKTVFPTRRSLKTWKSMTWNDIRFSFLTQVLKTIRTFKGSNDMKEIDRYLINTIKTQNFVAF
jgi:hypothetical protein